jgi:hypothetical protein
VIRVPLICIERDLAGKASKSFYRIIVRSALTFQSGSGRTGDPAGSNIFQALF